MSRARELYKGVWLLALCTVAQLAVGQVDRVEHLTRAYKVNPGASVDITNKYGNVHLNTWDKDSVRFEIHIELRAKNFEKLKKLEENLDFDFQATPHFVVAKTVTVAQKTRLGIGIQEAVEPLSSGSNNVEINYEVYLPASCELKVYNKFGDVFCDAFQNDVHLKVSHGDLKAVSIGGLARIDVRFGSAHVKSVKTGRFTVDYSEFTLDKGEKVSVNSKNSTITLDEVEELKANSRRDKFYIKKIKALNGESNFSDFYITEIRQYINITSKYGELNLSSIPRDFEAIQINSNFTDLRLSFEPDVSYKFGLVHRKVNFQYPLTLAKLSSEPSPTIDKATQTMGNMGVMASPDARVDLTAEGSDVVLIHK